jgi:hypothetical protein
MKQVLKASEHNDLDKHLERVLAFQGETKATPYSSSKKIQKDRKHQ